MESRYIILEEEEYSFRNILKEVDRAAADKKTRDTRTDDIQERRRLLGERYLL